MATIIDSFFAEFSIDPKGVETGSAAIRENLKKNREGVETSGKAFEKFGREGARYLSKLRNEAIGLFLTFQGASSLKGFVTDIITGDAATGRLAANIGMTTNRLSAWQLAIKQVGGAAGEADAALSAMTQAFQSYMLTGTTGHDADFKGLGVTLEDLQHPEEALLKMAEASERLTRPEFFARMQRLGIPPSVITLLERGRGATEELIRAKQKDGAATDADAAAAERLQAKLADLQNHILRIVRPAIYRLVDGLENLLDMIDGGTVSLPDFALALGAIAVAATLAGSPFLALAAAIGAAYVAWNSWVDRKPENAGKKGRENGWGIPGLFWFYDENDEEKKRRESGQYGPVAGGGGGGGGKSSAGVNRATGVDHGYIQDYLRARGINPETVRGIDAGITAEGGSLGMAANGAFGIGQWRGPRAKKLFAKYGRAPSLRQQLDFLTWELNGGDYAGGRVLAQTSAEGAMVSYLRDFMRPGPGLGPDLQRGYRALGKNPAPRAATGIPSDQSTHIGSIVVHAPGGDPEKIADKLPDAIRRRKLTTQANRGMN